MVIRLIASNSISLYCHCCVYDLTDYQHLLSGNTLKEFDRVYGRVPSTCLQVSSGTSKYSYLGDKHPRNNRLAGIDHEVHLREGETPTWGPLYSLSRTKLVVLKEWLCNGDT